MAVSTRFASPCVRLSAGGNTAFVRYRDRVEADVFKRLFDAVSEEPDMGDAMVDTTIVKIHRHGWAQKGG